MKRDKLYTINKGNKNLFAYAGSLNSIAAADKSNNPWDYADDLSTTAQFLGTSRGQAYANTKNALGITKAQNPFSQMNIGGTLTAAAPIVGGAVGGLLSGGMSTGVGNVMGGLGKAASAIPGPYGAAISAGLQIAGGAINGLFGEKVDQEKLARNNAGTSYLNNFSSNAATFDAVQGPQTQLAVQNAYKGGIFNKSAKRKNAAARADRLAAQSNAFAQVTNNVNNLVDSQMDNMLANYSAFGGALDLMQSNNYIDAINNRSNAIAKNNMQPYSSPSLFGSRELYSCGGQIKPNKYEFGGLEASFVDNFAKDPLAAVLDYNRGIEQRAAAKEASEAAAAQEAMMNELKLGLQKAQAENEGLWAMYGDQQKTLNGLLESSRYSAPYPTTSESEEGDLISGIANSGAKVVRDVMTGNNGGADDYRNLKEFIKKHESFVPKAYQLKGEAHPTIGYGFYDVYPGTNRKVKAGDTITKAEADKYLDAAIRNLDNILAPKVPNWSKMTNNQRDAIRDLAFGTGPWGAHFKPNSRLFQALRREDWAAAEKELRSKSASLDIYNKGLAKRSDRRQAMWRAGDYSVKAFGGELGTNGSDFTNGLLEINAGGSHEDNPFEGVQLGVDQNGVPNLVEEGETVFNDYVFSKRMVVPEFMKKQLGLGSAKDDITFADASKKIAQESVERPNDPISQAGLEAGLAKLAEIQETERMRMQAEQENADMEMSMMQGLSAYGGPINLFKWGGKEDQALKWLNEHFPKVGNKKDIAKVLAKRAKLVGYLNSDKSKPQYDYKSAYSGMVASNRPIGNGNEELFNSLVRDGLPRKVAFGLAYPSSLSYPYNGEDYNTKNTSAREAAYDRLIRKNGSGRTAGQASVNTRAPFDWNNLQQTPAYTPNNNEITFPFRANGQVDTPTAQQPLTQAAQQARQAAPVANQHAAQTSGNAAPAARRGRTSASRGGAGTEMVNTGGSSARNAGTWKTGDSSSNWNTYTRNGLKDYLNGITARVQMAPDEEAANQIRQEAINTVAGIQQAYAKAYQNNLTPSSQNEDVRALQTAFQNANGNRYFGNIADNINLPAGHNTPDTEQGGYVDGYWGPRTSIRNWGSTEYGNADYYKDIADLATQAGMVYAPNADWKYGDNQLYGLSMASQAPAAPETPTTVQSPSTNVYHAVVGDDDYHFENELDWSKIGDEVKRETLPNGDTVIYHAGKGPGADEAVTPAQQSTPASADITEKQPKPYQTWMRYAPIVGTGIATMTDLLGLTNKPDYSYADKIEALAERAGYAPNIRAPYIGDYMRHTPFDRLFYANQLQANSRATDRGLMNTSGGNRGAAQAGMLANGYNSQLGLGNLYRQAEEYNRGQYERTKAFNRGTNQFNAQMGLEADMANARYRQMASQYQMQGLGQAAAMRQAEDARTGAARSANFTNFLNNLGNLGRENFALNQILSSRDANNGYYLDNEGLIHRNGKVYAEVKNPSAFGGEVERYLKNKKKVRRSK